MRSTMTVGKKLLVGSGVGAALTLAVAASGYIGTQSIAASAGAMLRQDAQIALHSASVRINVLGLRRYEKDILINLEDGKKVEEYEGKFRVQRDALLKAMGALETVVVLPGDKERVTQMMADRATYERGLADVVEQVKRGQFKTASDGNKAVNTYKSAIHRLEKNAEDLAKAGAQRMDAVGPILEGQAQRTLWTIAGAALVAVVVGLVWSALISRTITGPLGRLVGFLRDLADGSGDLTRRLDLESQDEIGQMSRAFDAFMDKLHDIIARTRASATCVASASQQLSAASGQLSSGAQQQAASLEETAGSLEEITGTVKQNADNARQANQLAMASRDVAERGGQVVAEAVTSMTEINQASKKIADIITTIDEIAFQTNLLALNAAVEAARAGEQGRGFAVVASEVRNLAQRSATAAKEIKGLIQDSVQKVESGSELVNRSGETLTEIVGSVKRVTDIIAEIAAASQEQTTGIDQVNRAVAQMDQATQANAAQTEELSSTAQALLGQAGEMQRLVGGFKVTEMFPEAHEREGLHEMTPVGQAGSHHVAERPKRLEVPGDRRVETRGRGPVRQTDEVLMAAAPAGNGNGKAHHKDDEFEEF